MEYCLKNDSNETKDFNGSLFEINDEPDIFTQFVEEFNSRVS